jgi:hypothetical protein
MRSYDIAILCDILLGMITNVSKILYAERRIM